MPKSCSPKSNVNSVISLTSSSESAGPILGPGALAKGKNASQPQGPSHQVSKLHNTPARSLIPARQGQVEPQAHKFTVPSSFPVHANDVIPLARYGYDIRVSQIATKLGFHESITREVYEQVGSLAQMEEVLCVMQTAAKQCGEARIGKLVATSGDDVDTDSDSEA
ncbi:hypothetical protein OG21DRAFT_1527588 [Imleria badia]|nr:hypothetical protein OG21DRAFT_1591512 [Imleria badia]KAF8546807.1 hypothetical protein OG21DRAFT_1527588 [Imleria badia]